MPAAGSRAEFSFALDDARRARHLSIRQVARIADVPPATAQGWLSGKHFPTPALRPQYLRLVAELGLAEQVPPDLFGDPWPALQPNLRAGTAPYLGLRPFDIGDAPYYFGRSAESARLAERVAALRREQGRGVLALVGPSGSGKSSLLAAGLIATECADGRLAGWRAGSVPVSELATGRDADLELVVIDQFEDALRLPARDACVAAVERLASRAVVVIGLRSDAFAEASQLPLLVAALSSPVLLAPVTREELREVVVGPARLAGVQVDDELVRVLLDDLARGWGPAGQTQTVLPLLSNALLTTWAAGTGDRMTVADYYAAGGISRAVESLAEQVYGSLDEGEQAATERLFLRLITVTPEAVIRRPLPLAAIDRTTRPVMDAFVAARMLTVAGDAVQISHDALLEHWERPREWIAARREDLAVLAKVRRAAAVWEDAGRDPAALVPVDRLEAVSSWLEDPSWAALLAPHEQEFLDASERHFASVLVAERRANARLRRQRGLALGLTAVATALAVVSGFAFWGMRESQQAAEASRLQAQSRQVATAARSLRAKDPNLQDQMAVVSAELADTLESRSVLLDATAVDAPVQWRGGAGPAPGGAGGAGGGRPRPPAGGPVGGRGADLAGGSVRWADLRPGVGKGGRPPTGGGRWRGPADGVGRHRRAGADLHLGTGRGDRLRRGLRSVRPGDPRRGRRLGRGVGAGGHAAVGDDAAAGRGHPGRSHLPAGGEFARGDAVRDPARGWGRSRHRPLATGGRRAAARPADQVRRRWWDDRRAGARVGDQPGRRPPGSRAGRPRRAAVGAGGRTGDRT